MVEEGVGMKNLKQFITDHMKDAYTKAVFLWTHSGEPQDSDLMGILGRLVFDESPRFSQVTKHRARLSLNRCVGGMP